MTKKDQTALFVPLKTEYFEAFAAGTKTDELRRYGPGWNERTCHIGRAVTLSKGYGRRHRLSGRVVRFKKQHGTTFGSTYKASIGRLYGTLDLYIACIGIEVYPPASEEPPQVMPALLPSGEPK